MPVSRRQIVRACKGRGWQIQPEALKGLEGFLVAFGDVPPELMTRLADDYMVDGKKTLSKEIWQQFCQDQESFVAAENNHNNENNEVVTTTSSLANPWSNVQVVEAFRDVRLVFHTMKKNFNVEEQPWSLYGKAEDKVRLICCCRCRCHLLVVWTW